MLTLAADSLNGHRKLEACLKAGPAVKISCTKSSTQMMLCLPKACNMELTGSTARRLEILCCRNVPKAYASTYKQQATCRPYLLNDGVVNQRNATLVNLQQTDVI